MVKKIHTPFSLFQYMLMRRHHHLKRMTQFLFMYFFFFVLLCALLRTGFFFCSVTQFRVQTRGKLYTWWEETRNRKQRLRQSSPVSCSRQIKNDSKRLYESTCLYEEIENAESNSVEKVRKYSAVEIYSWITNRQLHSRLRNTNVLPRYVTHTATQNVLGKVCIVHHVCEVTRKRTIVNRN